MYLTIGKNIEFELNVNVWNPLSHISLKKSVDIHIYDEEFQEFEPCIYVNLSFIFISLEIYFGKVMGDEDDETECISD